MLHRVHRPEVERAMRAVARERFIAASERALARCDTALPIACGQTISQPSLVAYMTERLELAARSRVLEIGTGSGYQTAILAELAGEVFTIERIQTLAREAQARLTELGYRNVRFRLGDGTHGWPEQAPFDAIIVTAAAGVVPQPLIDQLGPGGSLVIPVGPPHGDQQLVLVEKSVEGAVSETGLLDVRFVPLLGGTIP